MGATMQTLDTKVADAGRATQGGRAQGTFDVAPPAPLSVFIGTTIEDNPVAQHFIALGEALARRGHHVMLITPHRKTDLVRPETNPAITTWPSERPTRPTDAAFLWKLARERHADVFIANFAAVNMMSLVGKFRGTPVRIAWYHTVTEQIAQDHPRPNWQRALLNLRKGVFYRMATHIVANSHASEADVRQAFHVSQERCRVFYNSLSDPLVHPHLQALSPLPRRVVCVGRLFPSKGQDVLLRAVAQLKNQDVCCQLDLVGVGPAEADYKRLADQLGISSQCRFLGRLTHSQVLAQMRSATVVASPSRNEAFGLVNIEALSVGTPLVASAVGGIREIIRDGKEGFLVEPDNPPALAARLKSLLCDEALRAQFASAARDRFLTTFEQGKIVLDQVHWLESVAAARTAK